MNIRKRRWEKRLDKFEEIMTIYLVASAFFIVLRLILGI